MPAIEKKSYDVAVAELLALGHELHATPSRKFDLANMRVLLGALGNPQRRFQSVLIAGTNGKGSTAAMLFSILKEAGLNAGLYTSPHLVRVNERIRTAAGEISDPEFAEMHHRVEEAAQQLVTSGGLPWHPSFFEMLTAMAFEYFASAGVEIAVLEVGMGGRLDATNVVDPCISVITDIALDHQNFLGNTLGEIAREKAGIIREQGTLVTLAQHPEANQVIGNTALERGATVVNAVDYVPMQGSFEVRAAENGASESVYSLELLGEKVEIHSPLSGRHQLRNTALAIAAAVELKRFGLAISASDIAEGIRKTHWPGRFQVFPAREEHPGMVLDVAHNPAGAWALRSALSERYAGRPLIFVFGAMRDKAVGEMAQILFRLGEAVVATQVEHPRAAAAEEIRAAAANAGCEAVCAPNVASALARARTVALLRKNPLVVITGSIYLVGEALRQLAQKP